MLPQLVRDRCAVPHDLYLALQTQPIKGQFEVAFTEVTEWAADVAPDVDGHGCSGYLAASSCLGDYAHRDQDAQNTEQLGHAQR